MRKNWEGALRVARSAEKGVPGNPNFSIGGKPANSKLSLREFAEQAKVDRETGKALRGKVGT